MKTSSPLCAVLLLSSFSALAQAPLQLDQGVISGLGIRNIGSATMGGRVSAVAAAHRKNGDSWVVYLDPDQFLEIRIVTHHMVRGQERVNTTDVGEYEKVDGLYFPFEIGRAHVETMTLNPEIDAKQYAYPVAADAGAHK